jgi:hypothetical protein
MIYGGNGKRVDARNWVAGKRVDTRNWVAGKRVDTREATLNINTSNIVIVRSNSKGS